MTSTPPDLLGMARRRHGLLDEEANSPSPSRRLGYPWPACAESAATYRAGAGLARAVLAMAGTLAHRGPDGEGVHVDGPVALGHRRLSIIDLSEAASEPMTNEDGSLWLVFNGEIYNFRELRRGSKRGTGSAAAATPR